MVDFPTPVPPSTDILYFIYCNLYCIILILVILGNHCNDYHRAQPYPHSVMDLIGYQSHAFHWRELHLALVHCLRKPQLCQRYHLGDPNT